jgi:oxygen-independent coproporphyrinogen-3 oxidase
MQNGSVPSTLPVADPAPIDGRLPVETLEAARGTGFGVYVHVPFCETRCGYCDFNTYTALDLGANVNRGSYADSVVSEIRLAARVLGESDHTGDRIPPVSSVFFGGGTPTLLPAAHLGRIVREIAETFGLAANAEVTTEANPETVSPAYFGALRAAGFTRVSLGMQSAVPSVLEVLDRRHRPGRPEECVAEAHAAGFEHVNLDLIYGAPTERDVDWRRSLETAIDAGPDHISAYALVVEHGTALARKVDAGQLDPPDDDVLADRYLIAEEMLAAAGFQWYEVSNWARTTAARSTHNDLYWSDANWWGFGPGAHSHVGDVRWWNTKHPARYAALLGAGRSPAVGREVLDDQDRLTERVMLGVRRRSGLTVGDVPPIGRTAIPQLVSWGLIEPGAVDAGRVVLTLRGRLLADAVVRELLRDTTSAWQWRHSG